MLPAENTTPARERIRLIVLFGLIAGLGATLSDIPHANAESSVPDSSYSSLQLTGIVRDFQSTHPDFQRRPVDDDGAGRFGHYIGIVGSELGENGKPVYASGGRRVSREWTDAKGRNIAPSSGNVSRRDGDSSGSAGGEGAAVEGESSLAQWFRDVPGVNQSTAVSLTLSYDAMSETYVFDDREDENYRDMGGFFPINGELYGDYQNGKNYHFTFELDTEFIYDSEAGMRFTFNGDDDVWVYIDGKLVIDLGGVHSQIEQTIELDRLDWLQHGENYVLKFFFAERHTTLSNFRIETNIPLRMVNPPQTAALHD